MADAHAGAAHDRAHTSEVDLVRHNDLVIVRDFADAMAEAGLDSLDAIFSADADDLAKPGLESWRQRLRIKLPDGAAPGRTIYVKRYVHPPRRAARDVRRARCGARSTGGLEWAWLRRFKGRGILAAEPIAFGEELRGRRELRSAVIVAEVAGQSLEKVAAEGRPLDRALARSVIMELAQIIGRMHRTGFFHRDLYLSHVFFNAKGSTGGRLCLIDLQRVISPRVFMSRWVVKDLAALNYSTPTRMATRSDRLRFLIEYLRRRDEAGHVDGAVAGQPVPIVPAGQMPAVRNGIDNGTRRLLYRIVGKTAQIAQHDRARNRRLARTTGGGRELL